MVPVIPDPRIPLPQNMSARRSGDALVAFLLLSWAAPNHSDGRPRSRSVLLRRGVRR